jgi:FMN-dependent oxidoreductase (nitrilotriacetate monooxygenase family)
MSASKMFHLAWFVGNGSGVQGWGSPSYPSSYRWDRPQLFQDMARQLERACFDFMLPEDSAMVPDVYGGSMEAYLRSAAFAPKFDPAVMASFVAQATSHIGIVPTLSTVYYPPFLLARLVATLDHLTGGRIGWNVVTSTSDLGAQNYGLEGLPEHDLRYDMADEFVELCELLWQSWEPGAVLADLETGRFADHEKVHTVDFVGKWYKSRGPLNLPAGPQGRPMLAQAGNSPRGRAFSSQHADVVMVSPGSPTEMKAFRDDIRARAVAHGRDPDNVKVFFIASPVLFDTLDDANAYLRHAAERATDDAVASSLASLGAITGVDFSRFALDEPLPDEVSTNGNQSTLASLRAGGTTVRTIGLRWAGLGDDPNPMVGTPGSVADAMESVMDEVGGDGFLITGPLVPDKVVAIVDRLVPALRKRGLVRTEYSSNLLRENVTAF